MTDTATLTRNIDAHLVAYAEPDTTKRAELVGQAWHIDGMLIDPPFDGRGHDGIAAMTDVVLAHYPGHTFRRTTPIDAHHTFARYGWELVAPDGTVVMGGTDVVECTEDGHLARIIGFFGALGDQAD